MRKQIWGVLCQSTCIGISSRLFKEVGTDICILYWRKRKKQGSRESIMATRWRQEEAWLWHVSGTVSVPNNHQMKFPVSSFQPCSRDGRTCPFWNFSERHIDYTEKHRWCSRKYATLSPARLADRMVNYWWRLSKWNLGGAIHFSDVSRTFSDTSDLEKM